MKLKHIEGIDYLRVIMSLFVVVWHVKSSGKSLIYSHENFFNHSFSFFDFFDFHVLLMAVPAFILVSLFLFASQGASAEGLRKRLLRLTVLTVFWSIILIRYKRGPRGLSILVPHSVEDAAFILFRSGYTIFYFFISLIICLSITYLIAKWSTPILVTGFIISILLVLMLPCISILTNYFSLSSYWNPLNFIAFPFAAVLLKKNSNYLKSNWIRLVLGLLLISFFFAVFEWKFYVHSIFFPGQDYAIPAYTRNSLLFSTMAVFIISLNTRIKSNRFIKYLSNYSLALYCLHAFFVDPAYKLVLKLNIQNQTIATAGAIIIVLVYSYTAAFLLKKFILKKAVLL